MQGSINFDGSLIGNITGGGGGGGSEVVITPVLTSGTKIADVTVDGVDYDIYSTDYSGDISSLQTGLSTANSNITALQGRVTTAEENITTLQSDMTAAESIIGDGQLDIGNDLTDAVNEINQSLSDLTPLEKTASGVIATFNDGSDLPMPSLKVAIEPLQSGSGDPSPTNVRPISGHTEANVTRCGKNLFDKSTVVLNKRLGPDGNEFNEVGYFYSAPIKVKSGDFYKNSPSQNAYHRVCIYDNNQAFVRTTDSNAITISSGEVYVRFSGAITELDTTQFEEGNQATAYEPYNGQTYNIQFKDDSNPLTVYGGSIDVVSGVLTVDRYVKTFTGTENISRQTHSNNRFYYAIPDIMVEMSTSTMKGSILPPDNTIVYGNDKDKIFYWYSGYGIYWRWDDYTSESSMKTKLAELYANGTPLQMLATLTTPLTIQLTPTQVKSLLGVNNIWANTGELELTYFVNNSLVYCIYDMINIL